MASNPIETSSEQGLASAPVDAELALPDSLAQDVTGSPELDLAPRRRRQSRGLWYEAGRDLVTRRRSGQVGLAIVLILISIALLAPILATHNPNDVLIGKE